MKEVKLFVGVFRGGGCGQLAAAGEPGAGARVLAAIFGPVLLLGFGYCNNV